MAMMQVISLTLLTNNLSQMHLRGELSKAGQALPNQLGKKIQQPTLKWVFHLLKKITRIRVKIEGKVFEQYQGIQEAQKIIINIFGSEAREIYGFT
jgi:transposase